jgi:hypothetical protein
MTLSDQSETRRHPANGHKIGNLYDAIGGPLYAVHLNGIAYAAFAGPNQAIAFWRGLDARGREYFHIENAAGERVRLTEHRRGHASAILDALDRAESAASDENRDKA